MALAFNEAGDLFCTDQEGATWLPNGNPFDELLHIQPGRHYGFPPRHPKYLPEVIDEPSVFDYAPQHQSTCGLNFNDPVNGGPVFGPSWWAGDAIVCGYSRGKIWRTKLVKTAAGYIAQNQLIVALSALTVDACVSPRGELVVATHGGDPDWGSGPNGQGHLYKIRYTGRHLPQPVLVWLSDPTEIRIAFDRTLDPLALKDLANRVEITQGASVVAGDRFEVKRPGYAVVYSQLAMPRYDVAVHSVGFTPDLRTLILKTSPMETAVNYGITLPGLRRRPEGGHCNHSDKPQNASDHSCLLATILRFFAVLRVFASSRLLRLSGECAQSCNFLWFLWTGCSPCRTCCRGLPQVSRTPLCTALRRWQ